MDVTAPAQKLEAEIDQSIDRLLVEDEGKKEEVPPTFPSVASPEPVRPPEEELGEPASRPLAETVSGRWEPGAQESDGPVRNLENLESHLLSLEWEISPDLIDKIISELGFLKETYGNDQALFQLFEVMGKVARSLADDEGNITPESLRFLLEAKDGIKLFCDELKDKEDYKNLVLSGILARYRIMQDQTKTAVEAAVGDMGVKEDAKGLTEALTTLSRQLQKEIRQLGVITRALRVGAGVSAPSQTVGTVLVVSSGRIFAIEKDIVIRSVQIPYRMVRTIWRDNEIRIRGNRFPLINLFCLFRFKGRIESGEKTVVLVKKGNRTLALLVDRLLQKKEIPSSFIQEEKRLAYVRGIASHGRGRKIYLLDTDRLMVEF